MILLRKVGRGKLKYHPPTPSLPLLFPTKSFAPSETRVGAIRLFLDCCWNLSLVWSLVSSFSDSLAALKSRFPRKLLLVLYDTTDMGVSGGVVKERLDGWLGFAAVTSGTEPRVGVGLLMTVPAGGCAERVMMDEADEDRAGLAGRPVFAKGYGTFVFAIIRLAFVKGEAVGFGVGAEVALVDDIFEIVW
jgi:hypothetical protein